MNIKCSNILESIKNNMPHSAVKLSLIAFCTVLSIIFTAIILVIGIFPVQINVAIIVVLVAMMTGIIYLIVRSDNNSKKQKLGMGSAIILSVLLAIGTYSLYSTYSVFYNISDSGKQTEEFYVLVAQGSQFSDIKEIENEKVYIGDFKSIAYRDAKKLLRKEADVVFEVGDYLEIGKKLANKEEDIIYFVNNVYYDILCEEIEGFKWKTKPIHGFSIDLETVDTSKRVEVTEDAFNIYISGIDTFGRIESVSRSDVNMIATVNPVTKTILLTSIPRDTYLELHTFGKKDKLTHSGIYGINETVGTVEDWLGIEINYYLRVNFTSLVDIVDIIGGIDVESPRAFKSAVSDYSYSKGVNHLSGEAALYFARERKALGGDSERIKNQQRVLTGIIEKITSPSILTKYTKILKAVEKKVQTSLTGEDMTEFIQMQIDNPAEWTIKTISVKGTGTSATTYSMGDRMLYVVIPNEESVKEVKGEINKILNQ